MKIVSFNNTQNLKTIELANGKSQLELDSEGNSIPIKGDYTCNVKFIIATDLPVDKMPTSLTIATMLAYQKQHASGKLQLLTEYENGDSVTEYSVDVDSNGKPKFTAIDWEATEKSPAIKGFTCTFKPAKKPWTPPTYDLAFGEQS
tara:strand:- start:77 stop:514 length:438 start_codon:yes stop_codon:yes gene_type:complete